MMSGMLYQASRGGVCAGLIVDHGVVTEAAPILRKLAVGRTLQDVDKHLTARGWALARIPGKDT